MSRLYDAESRGEFQALPSGDRHAGDEPPLEGDVLEPPGERAIRKAVFELRKHAYSYEQIAELVGITENKARTIVHARLQQIGSDELQDTELARRMQVEQLDAMIQAITSPATGKTVTGQIVKLDYGAMDRLMRLLEQKAKLLGLNVPQLTDLEQRLRMIAEEGNYDVDVLREIAKEVIESRLRTAPSLGR